ncbi:hypothetical protein NDU88_000495 [Pleurodeles waltl]|uniref:Uncharacterized protein n=1 Tax=Pleurodeles waltl TaxID=8319 RepID=A0AAV7ML08_PLEWA|nr:hypothetical protein NDU88_000495 [Pleurodeles waltl]
MCQTQRFPRCSGHLPRCAPRATHCASQGALVTFHAALHVPRTALPKVLWSPSTLRSTCRALRFPRCSGHLPRSAPCARPRIAPRAGHTASQGALVTFHAALHVPGTALPKVLWSPSTQRSMCQATHRSMCRTHCFPRCSGHLPRSAPRAGHSASQCVLVTFHAALHVPGTLLPKVLWSPSTLRYTCRAQRFPRCSGLLPRSVPRAVHCASQGALVTFHAALHVPGTALPKVLWSPSTQRSTCRAQRFPMCSGHLPRHAPRAGHTASQGALVTFHAALHVPRTALPKVLWSPSTQRSTCRALHFPRCSGHLPRSAPRAAHCTSQGALVTFHAALHVPGHASLHVPGTLLHKVLWSPSTLRYTCRAQRFPRCSGHLPRSVPCARPRIAPCAGHTASQGALVTFHAALHVPGTALPNVFWSPSTQRSTCRAHCFPRCSGHLPRCATRVGHSASQGALVSFHAAFHVPALRFPRCSGHPPHRTPCSTCRAQRFPRCSGNLLRRAPRAGHSASQGALVTFHAALHVPGTALPKVLWSPSTQRSTCRAQRFPMCSGHLPRRAPRAGHTASQGALVTFNDALHVPGTALPKVLWSPSMTRSTCQAHCFPRCSGHHPRSAPCARPRSAPCAGHIASQGALVTFHAALHVPGHAALHMPGTALPKVLWSPSTPRSTCRAQRFPRCSGHLPHRTPCATCRAQRFPRCSGHLPRRAPRAGHSASQGALVTFHAVLHVQGHTVLHMQGTSLPKVLWSPSTPHSTCRAQRFPRCSSHLPRSAPCARHSASQGALVTFHAALHVPRTALPKVLWSPSTQRSMCQATQRSMCGHTASQGALVTFHAALQVPGTALPKVLWSPSTLRHTCRAQRFPRSPSTQRSTCRALRFPRCSGHLPRSVPRAGHSASQCVLVTFHAALHVLATLLPKVLWSPSMTRSTCRAQRFPRCSGHLPRCATRAGHIASQGALVTFHAALHMPGSALPKVL